MKHLLILFATTLLTLSAFAGDPGDDDEAYYNADTLGHELLDNIANLPQQRIEQLGCYDDNYNDKFCQIENSRVERSQQALHNYDGNLDHTKRAIEHEIEQRSKHYDSLDCHNSYDHEETCRYEADVLHELHYIFLPEIEYAIKYFVGNLFRSYIDYHPRYLSDYRYGQSNYRHRRHYRYGRSNYSYRRHRRNGNHYRYGQRRYSRRRYLRNNNYDYSSYPRGGGYNNHNYRRSNNYDYYTPSYGDHNRGYSYNNSRRSHNRNHYGSHRRNRNSYDRRNGRNNQRYGNRNGRNRNDGGNGGSRRRRNRR